LGKLRNLKRSPSKAIELSFIFLCSHDN
jgi:hypothetical protein